MGGDSRQTLDPLLNINQYGCSPRPRVDVLALGSCTASSPTLNAWDAAQKQQEILKDALQNRDEDIVFEEHYEAIRQQLLAVLGLDRASIDVCFSPSATDGEFLALWLAIAGARESVCNIVVAPNEVGGGTPLAAKGFHFSDVTPWEMANGSKGKPVAGFPLERIAFETVPVRDAAGQLRPIVEVERQIAALVERQIKANRRVLLHVVEHTKTGIRAPSLGFARQLRERYGNGLTIVVDAAQGRIDRRRIAIYLQFGCLVLLSGSKFFGGPPFSGALLVPRTDQFQPRDSWEVPIGLTAYLTAFEVPLSWRSVRQQLPKRKNIGLLLRWASALSEMEKYYSHPLGARQLVLQQFGARVERAFSDSTAIRLTARPMPHLDCCDAVLGEDLEFERGVSVLSFSLQADSTDSLADCLDLAALRHVHYWLHQALLPMALQTGFRSHAPEVLQHKFHLGQPVLLSEARSLASDICVLRVAMGAALLNQLILDTTLGLSLTDRLDWLSLQLIALRHKLEAIAWMAQKHGKVWRS